MPRLKFDVAPEGPWRGETVEEHNAELREVVAGWSWWKGPLEPCSCGFHVEGMLCTCRPDERQRRTPEFVATLQQDRARRRHLEALAKKREFPALPRCPMGTCYWCRAPIVHGKAKQRSMHDGRADEPDCRWEYHLRTRLEAQRSHLLHRDGIGCASCGAGKGGWARIWTCEDAEKAQKWWDDSRHWKDHIARPDGPFVLISWGTALEVDHRIALAVAWIAFPEDARRRWFFAPANLRLLCADCHRAKTAADRLLLRQAEAFGADWLKAQVLRELADAGLLRPRQSEGTR